MISTKPDGKYIVFSFQDEAFHLIWLCLGNEESCLQELLPLEFIRTIKMVYLFQSWKFSGLVGHLKSWDSSIDLVNVLKHEIRDGQLSFRGKRVLEVIP